MSNFLKSLYIEITEQKLSESYVDLIILSKPRQISITVSHERKDSET